MEHIIKLLEKYGVDYKNNKAISNELDIVVGKDVLAQRLFKNNLNELILDLHNIKENNEKYFDYYLHEINSSKGETNYWGHRFELFFHVKLLQNISRFPGYFDYVRRGKDGIEPDFLISGNKKEIGIELTSLLFEKDNGSLEKAIRKIKEKLIEKSRKSYANDRCMLCINITNINASGHKNNFDLIEEINSERLKFEFLKDLDFKYGCVFFLNHFYGISKDDNIEHHFEPVFCIINDLKEMDRNLSELAGIMFPHIERDYSNLISKIYLSHL
jgi:hypothetical protein